MQSLCYLTRIPVALFSRWYSTYNTSISFSFPRCVVKNKINFKQSSAVELMCLLVNLLSKKPKIIINQTVSVMLWSLHDWPKFQELSRILLCVVKRQPNLKSSTHSNKQTTLLHSNGPGQFSDLFKWLEALEDTFYERFRQCLRAFFGSKP